MINPGNGLKIFSNSFYLFIYDFKHF